MRAISRWLGLSLCGLGWVMLAADSPQWIWREGERRAGQRAAFSRTFNLQAAPRQALLRVLSDGCAVAVRVNGIPMLSEQAGEVRREVDVARWLNAGSNTVALTARARLAAPAVAARLAVDGKLTLATSRQWAKKVVELGDISSDIWTQATPVNIDVFDDYTQWKRAQTFGKGTDPAAFQVPPGCSVELLRSAAQGEGSWVSLAFDPEGRLTIAREDKGLLRVVFGPKHRSITKIETINNTLRECRGLLYAHGALYANANNSKALYRLRDTNGDGEFDEEKLLKTTGGGVGHGRNDLALGPDGRIYAIHGDSVDLPDGVPDRTSPFRERRRGSKVREGFVMATDKDGQEWEIITAGLRNPYGIAFNPEGEAFTYDADAEFDMGSPWYRPTRVAHLRSGADFGWRAVTGSWPPYYPDHPDNAQPSLDIGKGSPTGVKFGTGSHFPAAYQRALFILDWTYGRIIAVHLVPQGAGYSGVAEVFLRGRPLNVTDLAFGPDGAMYFITGGRKTQSALYRVTYRGPDGQPPTMTPQQQARHIHAREARAQRRKLEAFHRSVGKDVLGEIWRGLGSADPALRYAARTALEHQPVALWRERAVKEQRLPTGLTAWTALMRNGKNLMPTEIFYQLTDGPWNALTPGQKQEALWLMHQCLGRDVRRQFAKDRVWATRFPDASPVVNAELARLLSRLGVPEAVPKILKQLAEETDQARRLHYLFVLRQARAGWTPEHRREYFTALREAGKTLGGAGMPKFVRQIRDDALAVLPAEEKQALSALLKEPEPAGPPPEAAGRKFVKNWKLADLTGVLAAVGRERDYENGKKMFSAALCVMCHRVGPMGRAMGPDLTAVGQRFGRRDLLEAILNPSKAIAENHQLEVITMTDGTSVAGRVVPQLDFRLPELLVATDPLKPDVVVKVDKKRIHKRERSPVSLMPPGLLNTLSRSDVLDLLAFLEAGGRKGAPAFKE